MSTAFCGVPSPHLVYVGANSQEDFDRIALPENPAGEWTPDALAEFMDGNGKQWERRCHSKTMGDHSETTVTVIFQWWESRVTETPQSLARADIG